MDRGGLVEVDLHEGLESTLVILGHKLKHTTIKVVRDYDRTLPKLTIRGSELNQVWTNLLDNAIDALGDSGTITIATRREGDCAIVEISDDGPGIPAEHPRPRLRLVLHDEGRRQGHRPGPGQRAADRRRPPRRLGRSRQLRAGAHDVSRLAAVHAVLNVGNCESRLRTAAGPRLTGQNDSTSQSQEAVFR